MQAPILLSECASLDWCDPFPIVCALTLTGTFRTPTMMIVNHPQNRSKSTLQASLFSLSMWFESQNTNRKFPVHNEKFEADTLVNPQPYSQRWYWHTTLLEMFWRLLCQVFGFPWLKYFGSVKFARFTYWGASDMSLDFKNRCDHQIFQTSPRAEGKFRSRLKLGAWNFLFRMESPRFLGYSPCPMRVVINLQSSIFF